MRLLASYDLNIPLDVGQTKNLIQMCSIDKDSFFVIDGIKQSSDTLIKLQFTNNQLKVVAKYSYQNEIVSDN